MVEARPICKIILDLQNFWLDDIDEPKFLREVERQANLQKELDDANVRMLL